MKCDSRGETIGLHLSLEYSSLCKTLFTVQEHRMKKKRILKDPDTGEIVGATRTPFSRQAKELNKQIFAEEFGRNRIEEEPPEEPAGGKGSLTWILLLAVCICGIWLWTESQEDAAPAAIHPLLPRYPRLSQRFREKNPVRNPRPMKKTMRNRLFPSAHGSSTRAGFSIAAPKT